MKNKWFAYTMRGRVIWISEKLFHIPVLEDLYRVHMIDDVSNASLDSCIHFTVEFFHKFSPNKLIHSPNQDADISMSHEKVKAYVKLSEFVDYSYKSSFPIAFNSESDKVYLLAESLLQSDGEDEVSKNRHHIFVEKLIQDKKRELMKRYLGFIHQLKNASTLDEVKAIGYKIVFEGIHVV